MESQAATEPMEKLDIIWIKVNITHFGERLTPWYFTRRGVGGMIWATIARGNDKSESFHKNLVFKTLEEARADTGVYRVFCFKSSSIEFRGLIDEIHKKEGLTCPHCLKPTTILELDPEKDKNAVDHGYTHYCWSDGKAVPNDLKFRQMTRPCANGCATIIKLNIYNPNSNRCDCGAPIVDHVPGGSHCRRPL